MKPIEKLRNLAQELCSQTPVLCADMELLHEDDPNRVLFGYSNGWSATFWEEDREDLFEEIDGTTTKTMVKVIKFCHVYCVGGVPDSDSEETRVRFAPAPEMALHAAMVECYSRELGMQLGLNI